MADKFAISIVIAARNMEDYIAETLQSIVRQNAADVEIILVDDGSTDATVAAADALRVAGLRFVAGPQRGVSAARNAGLDQAQAPLVLFLDADDVLLPGAIKAMVATLAQHPDAPAAFGGHVKMNEAGEVLPGGSRMPLKAGQNTLSSLIERNVFVNGGAICIRTAAARAVGGFNEGLAYGEDWEFWCRLSLLGDFVPMPGVVAVGYRQRAAGANAQKAGTATRPNFAPVNAIFSNVMITSHFSASELRKARRLAEASVFWSAARSALANGELATFFRYMLIGSLRHRSGMLRPGLALRYVASLIRLGVLPQARRQVQPK